MIDEIEKAIKNYNKHHFPFTSEMKYGRIYLKNTKGTPFSIFGLSDFLEMHGGKITCSTIMVTKLKDK